MPRFKAPGQYRVRAVYRQYRGTGYAVFDMKTGRAITPVFDSRQEALKHLPRPSQSKRKR